MVYDLYTIYNVFVQHVCIYTACMIYTAYIMYLCMYICIACTMCVAYMIYTPYIMYLCMYNYLFITYNYLYSMYNVAYAYLRTVQSWQKLTSQAQHRYTQLPSHNLHPQWPHTKPLPPSNFLLQLLQHSPHLPLPPN